MGNCSCLIARARCSHSSRAELPCRLQQAPPPWTRLNDNDDGRDKIVVPQHAADVLWNAGRHDLRLLLSTQTALPADLRTLVLDYVETFFVWRLPADPLCRQLRLWASSSTRKLDPPGTPAPAAVVKLIMLGASGVGKTHLLSSFTTQSQWPGEPLPPGPTVGLEFRIVRAKCRGHLFRVHVWDAAGSERYQTITSSYVRGIDGCMLVFDMGRRTTLTRAQEVAQQMLRSATCPVLLVGHHSSAGDARHAALYETLPGDSSGRVPVTPGEAHQIALAHGWFFCETHCDDLNAVNVAFHALVAAACVHVQQRESVASRAVGMR